MRCDKDTHQPRRGEVDRGGRAVGDTKKNTDSGGQTVVDAKVDRGGPETLKVPPEA